MACAYIYLLHCLVTANMLWFHWNYGRNYTCWCFCLLPFTRSKLIYNYIYIIIYISQPIWGRRPQNYGTWFEWASLQCSLAKLYWLNLESGKESHAILWCDLSICPSIHLCIHLSSYLCILCNIIVSILYIHIYIYMYYIDTHNMPNVKVEPAGSQPVRHRPTAWCLSSMLLGRNYLPSSWRVLVLGIGPFSSAAQAWSKACMLLGGGDDTSSPDPMPGIRWRRMW